MFNFGNLKIFFFTNLLLHSPLKNTGYKGADCQFGSINVPCPLSASIVWIVDSTNLGDGTSQLFSGLDQFWFNA